ncbi:MAG: helix-turn-helix domain-containing protein [Roseburia sp.]|nr:helix-turn-helix domain-containing protein [Roseburia sp.]
MQNVDLLMNSLEFIETHLKESFRTADIVKACYCSKSTLEKMFQYVYSTSVHEYIIRRRMMLAAKMLTAQPETAILVVAVECGYSSHEAFARAFKEIWNCNPSEFRKRKYTELYPRFREPLQEGDAYVMQRRSVDISELYDLFKERKACWFVCCDIKQMDAVNRIARKAGDLAIIETIRRMNAAAGEEDVVFRIGGDEFCILTDSEDAAYAERIADAIRAGNGEEFDYEGTRIPLSLYAAPARFEGTPLRYNELFSSLHKTIQQSK